MKNLKALINAFEEAQREDFLYVGVRVRMDSLKRDETIINPRENIAEKMKYYASVYDEGLDHKHASGIRIIDFAYANDVSELYELLNKYEPLQ